MLPHVRALRAPDARLLDRLLGSDTPLHGALLSYLLFDRHFVDGAIDLGRRDANRWLADHPDLWRVEPCASASRRWPGTGPAGLAGPRPRQPSLLR